MKIDFPHMTSPSGKFVTHEGRFFMKYGKGRDSYYRAIENYLPGSPTTYGMETLEQVAEYRFKKLEAGEVVIRMGLKDSGQVDTKKYKFSLTTK